MSRQTHYSNTSTTSHGGKVHSSRKSRSPSVCGMFTIRPTSVFRRMQIADPTQACRGKQKLMCACALENAVCAASQSGRSQIEGH